MKFIDKQLGQLFYDRIYETLSNSRLSPKERIPKYRTILDDIFKALTADSNQMFGDLFARTSFIFREYETIPEIKDHVHSLRKYSNKVVHESDFIPEAKDEKRSVYQLSEVINHFSKSPIPLQLNNFYKDVLNEIKKDGPVIRKKLPAYDFFAIVEDIYLPHGEMQGKFCTLTCNTDELGIIKLKMWDNRSDTGFGSNLAVFGEIVERYQTIYVTKAVQKSENTDEYSTTKESFVVLEPDYLLDAKELSDCRQFSLNTPMRYEDNPLLYILSRFTKGQITDSMMTGNIVGRMLDDIIISKDYNYKTTFESVMRENSFGMLCMANEKGSYERARIQKVYIEAQDHERQLKETLKIFTGKRLILEPTFISDKFGLQGRLDLLVDHGPSSNRKDIIELKSSQNYPRTNQSLYQNHEAQTMCYDLLISSTYPDRIGESSILYSNVPLEEKPLRNVPGEKYLSKQELLMLRNRIVFNEIKIARGEFNPFLEIFEDSFGPFPGYLDEQVNELGDIIHNLDPLLKKYFFGFLRFIYKELQVAKIGSNDPYSRSNGYADLWKATRAEKIDNYNVLVSLRVKEITDDFHITLEFDRDIFSDGVQLSSFRTGDTAVLYPTPDQTELNPLKSQILKCWVVNVAFDFIEISLLNKQVDKEYFNTSTFWALDRDFRETGYKQLLRSLYEFVKSDDRIRNLILGKTKPDFDNLPEIQPNGLDPVQMENVKKAISSKDYYLIQGPPGTGKTSKVLVEIVRNIINEENAVMVVAFTNRAVDEICEKLINLGIKCIRLGKGDKPYYWSYLSSKQNLNELNETVKKNNVFVSTIATFSNSLDLLKFKKFDTLIIDEASQVLEPQVTGFLKCFRRWIMIGDENQLPAVVIQNEEDSICKDEDLNELSLGNFRDSLFYRLKKNAVKNGWNESHGRLRYQYRMHNDIAEFPRKHFYNNDLVEFSDSQKQAMKDYSGFNSQPLNILVSSSRIVFVPSKPDYRTKINEEEAVLTARLIDHIAMISGERFEPGKTVGVITPFRAQIATIRNCLKGKHKDVTVDTVERFQGSERDIIILSFAVKSTAQLKTIQSVNDGGVDRKLNVAITRAKEQLIMLGNEEILKNNHIFKELIDLVKKKGGYIINPLKTDSLPNNLF